MTGAESIRRITWLDSQRLEAGDLADQHGREAFTRRLHTSIVHDAWGVALGFGTESSSGRGEVTVAPGLAYDRLGRELVCGRSTVVPSPVPPSDGASHWFDLVMRWAGLEDLRAGRDPAGSCLIGSAVYEERPLLRWADAGPMKQDQHGTAIRPSQYGEGVRLGLDLPLARILLNPDGGTDHLDLSTRRTAHGLARPHIAGGTIRQGVVELDQGSDHRRWSLSVDTGEGGFTSSDTTYLVALGAHPWGETSGFNSGDAGDVSARELLVAQLPYGQGPFLELSEGSRTQFRLTVRHSLPERLAFRGSIRVDLNPVPVHWVGVEWSGRAEPPSARRAAAFSPLINWTAGAAGGPM